MSTRCSPDRARSFDGLRTEGGLSGYPSQEESDHDIVENSHASTSLSYADGLAKAYAIRGRGPAHRGRHRRRSAHRRNGLGGAQQHRDRQELAPRHRRQRQRPLLHADRGRPDHRADHAAHQPPLRAGARPGQEATHRRAGRRPRGVRHPARDEEGPQGRTRAAGPVRGPRAQVRRTGRRPRPPSHGARAGPGQAVRRAGDRARDHPQGLRLRRRRAARGRPVPPVRAVRRRQRRADARRAGSGPTSSPTRWCTSAPGARTSSPSPPR